MVLFAFTTPGHISLGLVFATLALLYCGLAGVTRFGWRAKAWFVSLTVAAHNGPDLDSLTYLIGGDHEVIWGHRGISHSLCFGMFGGIVLAYLFTRKVRVIPARKWFWLLSAWFTLGFITHIIADMMCEGDQKVAWAWPLNSERQLLPWRPIPVFTFALDDGAVMRAFMVECRLIALGIALPFGAPVLLLTLVRSWRNRNRLPGKQVSIPTKLKVGA